MHDSASSYTQRLATRLRCVLLYPKAVSPGPDRGDIQDPASELPRILIPRTWVNKSLLRAYCLDVETRSQIRCAVCWMPLSNSARVLNVNLSPLRSTRRSWSPPIQLGNRLSST